MRYVHPIISSAVEGLVWANLALIAMWRKGRGQSCILAVLEECGSSYLITFIVPTISTILY